MPSDSPDGLILDLYGQEVVPANHIRRQGTALAPTIPATCGLPFSSSSKSAGLQLYLESKLHQQMDERGSISYTLTWSRQDTASGRRICVLLASGRRTSGSVFTGWQTPCARDGMDINPKGTPFPSQLRRNSPSIATRLLQVGAPWQVITTIYCRVMGYPLHWNAALFEAMATQLSPKSPQNSSKPTESE